MKKEHIKMGFFSGMFGTNSLWDGSKYIEKVTGQKFWHNGFIDKDNAIEYGRQFAMYIDPKGARRRPQDVNSLIGELIYYFQLCEGNGDEKALRYIATAMKKLAEDHPDPNTLGFFIAHTNYLRY